MSDRDRDKLSEVMEEVSFDKNDTIIAQGESADAMWVLVCIATSATDIHRASEAVWSRRFCTCWRIVFAYADANASELVASGVCRYIVLHGTCEAFVDGVGKVMTYSQGDFFGELALLTGGKRNASVVAGSSALSDSDVKEAGQTRLLKLRSKDFKRLTRGESGEVLHSQTKKYKGVDPAVLLALPGMATLG